MSDFVSIETSLPYTESRSIKYWGEKDSGMATRPGLEFTNCKPEV